MWHTHNRIYSRNTNDGYLKYKFSIWRFGIRQERKTILKRNWKQSQWAQGLLWLSRWRNFKSSVLVKKIVRAQSQTHRAESWRRESCTSVQGTWELREPSACRWGNFFHPWKEPLEENKTRLLRPIAVPVFFYAMPMITTILICNHFIRGDYKGVLITKETYQVME